MAGVGSTNAMKKGSGNNPFLAFSEADMQGYLNSAYTGCIVKYTGPSTKKGIEDVLPLNSAKSLGDAQNLVVNLFWAINNKSDYGEVAHPAGGTIRENPWHFTVTNKDTGKVQYIQEVGVDITNRKFVDISKSSHIAWLLSDWCLESLDDSLSFQDSLTKNVIVLECEDVGENFPAYWPTEVGWQKNCFNTEGKIILWSYEDTIELTCPLVYTYNEGPFSVEPYVVNELYKVVYGDGQYYFEEFYYISGEVTSATIEDVAPGKTFYDFTGTKQTGTGTKVNPYLAKTLDELKSYLTSAYKGAFVKYIGSTASDTDGTKYYEDGIYQVVDDGTTLTYAVLPTLVNEATADDVAVGKEFINGNGQKVIGNSQATEITSAFKNIVNVQSSDNLYEISEDALKGVSSIASYAFYYRSGLKKISLPDSITSVGTRAFSRCNNLTTFKAHSLEIIRDGCFESSPLMSIDVPNLTTIEYSYAMGGPNSFVNVELEFPKVTSVGQNAFYYCQCKSFSLPSIIDNFGPFNLYSNPYLESVNLPLLEKMPTTYFIENCNSITKIVLPKLTTLILQGISRCTMLKTIDLPSVTSIDKYSTSCFSNMGSVRLLLRYNGVVSLSATQLPNAITEVYVPSGQVDNYKSDAKWSTYANRIKSLDDFVE